MRANEFLSEEWSSLDNYHKENDPRTELPIGPAKPEINHTKDWQTIYEMIESKSGKFLANCRRNGTYIRRGMGTAEFAYAVLDPRKTIRKSANTNNIYTMFMDNSPKWEDYPPRSQSLVCSTGSYASDYGHVYAMFPYDNAPIGICPEMDLWQSFEEGAELSGIGYHSLDDLVRGIALLLYAAGWGEKYVRSIVNGTDYEAMVKLFYEFDQLWPKEKLLELDVWDDGASGQVRNLMVSKGLTLYQVLDLVVDPKLNGFKVRKGANFHGGLDGVGASQEIWIGGPAIAVSINPYDQDRYPQLRPLLHKLGLGQFATPEPKPRPVPPKVPKMAKPAVADLSGPGLPPAEEPWKDLMAIKTPKVPNEPPGGW